MYYHANNQACGAGSPSVPLSERRFIKMGHACLGVSEGRSLTLTGADRHDSLLWSRRTGNPTGTAHRWSPYGSGKPADASLPGFNGERIDPVSGTYHLGNGYRAYNPVLMRFNCPDSLSPFGKGGINPYAYCAGDPVNHTDPSGHLSWQAILGIALGAVGLAAAIFTGGMSVVAAGSVAAALSSASTTALVVGGIGVVADVTAIASGAMEASDPSASSVLGWVALATGAIGGVTGLAGLGKSIRNLIKGSRSYNVTKAAKLSAGRKTRYITLGGNMKNTDHLQDGIYTFTDIYKQKNRLNIVAHGELVGESSRMVIGPRPDGIRHLDADTLANWLKECYEMPAYDNLRTASCYSGNGGEASFAARLSRATGKPVKGYIDEVTYPYESYGMTNLLRQNEANGTYKAFQDILAEGHSFKIKKTNPYDINDANYSRWTYQPVKFFPT